MSNLTMPTMTYAALLPRFANHPARRIANLTKAQLFFDHIGIYHHGNRIAALYSDDSIFITNSGWETPTTRTRLNKILRDNDIFWSVTQKNFVQYLVNDVTRYRRENFYSAEFNMRGSLVRFNGYNTVTGK